jgi:hypothetical protein
MLARVRAGLRIVALTQESQDAARELVELRAEVDRVRTELADRGIEWPGEDEDLEERRAA